MSTTDHRPPCIAGSVCGEPAHCPPATRPAVTDDLRAGIEALIADPFRGYGVNVVRVSDLDALLAAHPVQDEGAARAYFGEGYEFALIHLDDEPVQADLARLRAAGRTT